MSKEWWAAKLILNRGVDLSLINRLLEFLPNNLKMSLLSKLSLNPQPLKLQSFYRQECGKFTLLIKDYYNFTKEQYEGAIRLNKDAIRDFSIDQILL